MIVYRVSQLENGAVRNHYFMEPEEAGLKMEELRKKVKPGESAYSSDYEPSYTPPAAGGPEPTLTEIPIRLTRAGTIEALNTYFSTP